MAVRLSNKFSKKCNLFLQVLNRHSIRTVKSDAKDIEAEEPIKYSTSKAAKWMAKYSTSGEAYFSRPKQEGFVVATSLAILMIYFCILREENDIDDWMRNMEKIVPLQIEEGQLQISIREKKKKHLSTLDEELRLAEVLKLKENISNQ